MKKQFVSFTEENVQHHYNICFNVFPMFDVLDGFLWRLSSISVFSYVFAGFFSFRSLLITSFIVVLGRPLEKLPVTLRALHN